MEERSPSGRPSLPLAAMARLVSAGLAFAAGIVPARWARLRRPVFLVGCSLESATRLAEVLECHADVAPWRIRSFGGRSGRSSGLETGDAALRRLGLALRLYSLMLRRRRTLVTAPGALARLDHLDRVFPGCRVVHVVRDARPEILGKVLSRRKRTKSGETTTPPDRKDLELDLATVVAEAQQWSEISGRIQDQGTALLGPDRYAEIRVEEFRDHPDYQLSRLDAFCELDPARRDRAAVTRLLRDHGRDTDEGLSPEAVEKIRAVAGERLARLGYRID
jgi:hypothetical protein